MLVGAVLRTVAFASLSFATFVASTTDPWTYAPMFSSASCEGLTLDLACPAGTTIAVFGAFFGRSKTDSQSCPGGLIPTETCSSPNAVAVVTQLCQGRNTCTVNATLDTFGGADPCLLTRKVANVSYACVASMNQTNSNCEGEYVELLCGDGMAIQITDAFYGRKAGSSVCGETARKLTCSADVKAMIDAQCWGTPACWVLALSSDLGVADPCPGLRKYLDVSYNCIPRGQIGVSLACESTTALLSCPSPLQSGLHIRTQSSTLFGRTTNALCAPVPGSGIAPLTPLSSPCVDGTIPSAVSSADQVKSMCDGAATCAVRASAGYPFVTDPCYGTPKYLNAQFVCSTN